MPKGQASAALRKQGVTARDPFDSIVDVIHDLLTDLSVHTDPIDVREPRPEGRAVESRSITTYLLLPSGQLQKVLVNIVGLDR